MEEARETTKKIKLSQEYAYQFINKGNKGKRGGIFDADNFTGPSGDTYQQMLQSEFDNDQMMTDERAINWKR